MVWRIEYRVLSIKLQQYTLLTTKYEKKGELMRRYLIAIIFLIVSSNNSLYACSCSSPQSPEKEFVGADFVFTGKVIKVEQANNLAGELVVNVTFEVIKSYKGNKDKLITVNTAPHGKSCGISFEQNNQYLVYASINLGKLSANSCSRTSELGRSAEDLKILDSIAGAMIQK